MRKRYNTPHRSRVVKTRMTEEEYAEFAQRLSAYNMSQAEFIRQAITGAAIRPIITVSPVNDELLAAVGKLTAEYGRIGGNLNQISMRNWTFEHDNGRNPQTETARFYVESWETMQAENIGYLFWGGVGTGKSYLAACIANALMEKEVAVCMTNFATILGDLAASFEGRNEYISRLCSYPLLILDDFGMERGTEYGLEQVYSVIDSRYRSGKPLIATTNLTLEELQHPQDTPHARIYDRLTSMCAPVRFTGSNFRKETAQEKLERLKQLMKQRKESL